jgi:hypothetical protein
MIALRKISELSQDEFFDAHQAILPLIPEILNTEAYRAAVYGQIQREVMKAGLKKEDEQADEQESLDFNVFVDMNIRDQKIIADIFTRKEFRQNVRDFVSVLTGSDEDSLKELNGVQYKGLIAGIINDKSFQSFLAFAELPETDAVMPE